MVVNSLPQTWAVLLQWNGEEIAGIIVAPENEESPRSGEAIRYRRVGYLNSQSMEDEAEWPPAEHLTEWVNQVEAAELVIV